MLVNVQLSWWINWNLFTIAHSKVRIHSPFTPIAIMDTRMVRPRSLFTSIFVCTSLIFSEKAYKITEGHLKFQGWVTYSFLFYFSTYFNCFHDIFAFNWKLFLFLILSLWSLHKVRKVNCNLRPCNHPNSFFCQIGWLQEIFHNHLPEENGYGKPFATIR